MLSSHPLSNPLMKDIEDATRLPTELIKIIQMYWNDYGSCENL